MPWNTRTYSYGNLVATAAQSSLPFPSQSLVASILLFMCVPPTASDSKGSRTTECSASSAWLSKGQGLTLFTAECHTTMFEFTPSYPSLPKWTLKLILMPYSGYCACCCNKHRRVDAPPTCWLNFYTKYSVEWDGVTGSCGSCSFTAGGISIPFPILAILNYIPRNIHESSFTLGPSQRFLSTFLAIWQ